MAYAARLAPQAVGEMEENKKPKPLMEPFGSVKLDSFIVYDDHKQSITTADDRCLFCKGSDDPRMFVDLELVDDHSSPAYRGFQLHLGFMARRVHRPPARRPIPRARVDVYLSLKEARVLHARLGQLLSRFRVLE